MKILIVSSTFGQYGGIEAFVVALASQIEKWKEFDLRVCFKVMPGWELEDGWNESVQAKLNCPIDYVRRGELKLLRLIRWADVIHAQNTPPDVIFPAWLMRKKIVLTIHNWRRRGFGLHSILWGIGARLAQHRWYNSKFVWDTWEPKIKLEGSDCVPTVCRFPETSNPPEQRKGFLFIGRWIENKGIEDLVQAYARLNLDPAIWPLILVGDGPLKETVTGLIANHGLANVEMPGFIDDQRKANLLAAAKWLIAPARTREDMGLTPIEARSVGVPSIVTRDGGLPEAAGEAALIVEPGDIDGLSRALQQAASMSEVEYCERADLARESLKEYLRPMQFYRNSYLAMAAGGSE
jgi:glycosyltransferase involved in cell wall biosynthesis